MKKIFIAALALAAVAACNKAEVIDMAPQKAISFADPFVDASTKVIDNAYTAANTPSSFKVYGTLSNGTSTVNIFDGIDVVKNPTDKSGITGDKTWYYAADKVQYWMKGNTYNFAAVVGGTVTPDGVGMPASIAYTTSTQQDLLYARPEAIVCDGSQSNVAFTLDHLLTKVVFKFTNAYPAAADMVVKIDDVKILNAAGSGSYAVDGTWTTGADAAMSFGPVVASDATAAATAGVYIESDQTRSSNYAKLLIPETQVWNIAFTANVYYKSGTEESPVYTLVNKFEYTTAAPLTTGATALALAAGKSYNFNITVGGTLNPITFSATTVDWTDGAGTDVTVQ